MPLQLPSAEDLGVPNLQSGRSIASWDTSAAGRGEAAGGAAIKAGGDQLASVGFALAKQDEAKQDTLQQAQAKADLLISTANRKQSISDATDSADLEKTHAEGAAADLDTAAQRISDPNKRQLFIEQNRPLATDLGNTAKNKAFNLDSDAERASVLDQLQKLREKGAADTDPTHKEEYVKTGQDLIKGLQDKGYITDVQAQQQRQQWATDYAVQNTLALPPGQRLAAVRGGWEGALINKESSGNPRVVNPWGYAGLYQMGAPLLNTLGLYTPGSGENLQGWSKTDKDAPGKWSGTFNIPGFPQVKTLDDFRNNPDAQRAAFQASTAYYDQQIASRGLDKFIGTTVGGVPITREGIYSMMHLGGVAGAQSALITGGGSDARDANGSSVLSYARMAANAGPGGSGPAVPGAAVASYIPADKREAIASGAIREIVANDRSQQQAIAAESATVKSLMKDDEASIMQSGAPVKELTPERVAKALGPAIAQQFEQNRAQAQRYHDQTNDWDSIPLGEINTRLNALKPTPGTPGYDSANQYYAAAQKQAQAVTKERTADPAAAADRLPEVQQAKQGASLDVPQTYRDVVRQRMIGQERLGIPEDLRVPLTRAEAQGLWKPIAMASPDDQRDVIKDTVKQLQDALGDHADSALMQVLREGHADKATREMTAIVLKKLANNQVPTPAEAKAVDDAAKTAAMDRATAGLSVPNDLSTLYGGDPAIGNQIIPPKPAGPSFPVPDDGALDMLRKKPELAKQFDAAYGPGASEKVLKGH